MFKRFLNATEDCQWLRETALDGYDPPAFESFTFDGNEDCPLAIALYTERDPNWDDAPVAIYRLVVQYVKQENG